MTPEQRKSWRRQVVSLIGLSLVWERGDQERRERPAALSRPLALSRFHIFMSISV